MLRFLKSLRLFPQRPHTTRGGVGGTGEVGTVVVGAGDETGGG